MKAPQKYESIQDYLLAEQFTIEDGHFVRGKVRIPFAELARHTPRTFHEKALAQGWFDSVPDEPEPSLYQWGDQFIVLQNYLYPVDAYYAALNMALMSDSLAWVHDNGD